MNARRKKRRSRWHSLFLWHRYMGLAASLFVVILAITGLLLNHGETLKLDRQYVQSQALLAWYDISPPAPPVSYPLEGQWISQLGDQLYFNDQRLAEVKGPLLGVASSGNIIVIALEGRLLLITPQGEIIEQLGDAEGVPAGIQAISSDSQGRLLISAAHGTYQTDDSFTDWRPTDFMVSPIKTVSTPTALSTRLLRAYRGNGLPLERVLLDIHSGRILGAWGTYVMYGAALLLLALAVCGVWVWASRRRHSPRQRAAIKPGHVRITDKPSAGTNLHDTADDSGSHDLLRP